MTTVTLKVGEATKQALNDNAQQIPPDAFDDLPLIWPENDMSGEVFHFIYTGQQTIIFPQARIIWANQAAGVITSITVTGPKDKSSLATVYGEIEDVVRQLTLAGWIQVKPLPSLSTLTSAVFSEQAPNVDATLTSLKKDDVDTVVRLAAPGDIVRSGSQDQPVFIYEVKFSNSSLEDRQENKMYDERIKVNGNVNKSLPFSYWLNQQTR